MSHSIQLDIDFNITISKIKSLTKKYNINFELITKSGPASGNPIYKFSSNIKSDLELFLNKNYQTISATSGIINI
jgi:hypothetical protein|tara:strand:- start:280 stop:504 length:225 start_codon:yes stop_codon:yes gene_type:complete